MATDATGTPTSLGIPKYNTSTDAPSGKGFNAAMDALDTLIAARITKPGSPSSNQALVWNGTTWVSQQIADAQIAAGAAIAYAKLALSNSILNADINSAAAIAYSKLALTGNIVNADLAAAAAIGPQKVTKFPYCIAYRANASGSQSFGSASGTYTWSASQETTANQMWSGGNPTRITAPLTGFYRLAVSVYNVGGSSYSTDNHTVRKNGSTTIHTASADNSGSGDLNADLGVIALTAADYLEVLWNRVAATTVATQPPETLGIGMYTIRPAITPAAQHYGAISLQYIGQ